MDRVFVLLFLSNLASLVAADFGNWTQEAWDDTLEFFNIEQSDVDKYTEPTWANLIILICACFICCLCCVGTRSILRICFPECMSCRCCSSKRLVDDDDDEAKEKKDEKEKAHDKDKDKEKDKEQTGDEKKEDKEKEKEEAAGGPKAEGEANAKDSEGKIEGKTPEAASDVIINVADEAKTLLDHSIPAPVEDLESGAATTSNAGKTTPVVTTGAAKVQPVAAPSLGSGNPRPSGHFGNSVVTPIDSQPQPQPQLFVETITPTTPRTPMEPLSQQQQQQQQHQQQPLSSPAPGAGVALESTATPTGLGFGSTGSASIPSPVGGGGGEGAGPMPAAMAMTSAPPASLAHFANMLPAVPTAGGPACDVNMDPSGLLSQQHQLQQQQQLLQQQQQQFEQYQQQQFGRGGWPPSQFDPNQAMGRGPGAGTWSQPVYRGPSPTHQMVPSGLDSASVWAPGSPSYGMNPPRSPSPQGNTMGRVRSPEEARRLQSPAGPGPGPGPGPGNNFGGQFAAAAGPFAGLDTASICTSLMGEEDARLKFDARKGRLTVMRGLEFTPMRWSHETADAPVAHFADPEAAAGCLDSISVLLKALQARVDIVRTRVPDSQTMGPDYARWLDRADMVCVQLVIEALVDRGVSENLLAARIRKVPPNHRIGEGLYLELQQPSASRFSQASAYGDEAPSELGGGDAESLFGRFGHSSRRNSRNSRNSRTSRSRGGHQDSSRTRSTRAPPSRRYDEEDRRGMHSSPHREYLRPPPGEMEASPPPPPDRGGVHSSSAAHRRARGWQSTCPHPGCGRRGMVNEIEDHSRTCEHRIQNCPNQGCYQQVKVKHLDAHLKYCSYTPVPCSWDGCSQKVKQGEFEAHLEVCDCRLVFCPLKGCEREVKARSLQSHILECIKQRGNVTYDGDRNRLVVLKGLDFSAMPRSASGTSLPRERSRSPMSPRFEFRNTENAARTLDDLAHLLDMPGVLGGEVVVVFEQARGRTANWPDQVSARRQAEQIVDELIVRNICADKLLASAMVVPPDGKNPGALSGVHIDIQFGNAEEQSLPDSYWPPPDV